MKEFVLYIARALAEHPDDIRVTVVEGNQTFIVELRCHQKDLGRLIGRNGKTIGAFRTLLNNGSFRQGRRVILELAD